MRLIVAALLMALWADASCAEDPMVRECEATAASDVDRGACARLADCLSQCGGDDACVLNCTAPGRGAPSAAPPPVAAPAQAPAAKSGPKRSKPVDRKMLCVQLYKFRDHELFHLWETEQKKYDIFTEGSQWQVKWRDEAEQLMDKQHWAGSTGAALAIEIKASADGVTDAIGILIPGEPKAVHLAEEIAQRLTEGVGAIVTAAKENAMAGSIDAGLDLFVRWGGPIGSAARLLHDAAGYIKTKEEAAAYQDIVQDQVRRINQTLRILDEKRMAAVQKTDAYQQIVRSIDLFCSTPDGLQGPPIAAPP